MISWSHINEWDNQRAAVRSRRKLDAQAYHLARQFVLGTAPADGCIVCPDEYDAAQLFERLKFWIDKLRSTQT